MIFGGWGCRDNFVITMIFIDKMKLIIFFLIFYFKKAAIN